jgi:hypothetical protein
MREKAILEIDRAALALAQTLDTYGAELKAYLEPEHLERLQAEVINLRRVLLGLEMGLLYQDWEVPAEILEQVASQEMIPVEKAVPQVVNVLIRGPGKGDQA